MNTIGFGVPLLVSICYSVGIGSLYVDKERGKGKKREQRRKEVLGTDLAILAIQLDRSQHVSQKRDTSKKLSNLN